MGGWSSFMISLQKEGKGLNEQCIGKALAEGRRVICNHSWSRGRQKTSLQTQQLWGTELFLVLEVESYISELLLLLIFLQGLLEGISLFFDMHISKYIDSSIRKIPQVIESRTLVIYIKFPSTSHPTYTVAFLHISKTLIRRKEKRWLREYPESLLFW